MEKIVLITGSTDGIGRATALELARRGVHVILHGRDRGRGTRVLGELKKATGSDSLDLFIADFRSRPQIIGLARDISSRYDHLDVLINNAGTYKRERIITSDGLETTFAVNVLAPFLLTHLLLPQLEEGVPSRVVNVASIAHRSVSVIDWGNLQGERYYDAYKAYSLSKFADIAFTYALARRLLHTDVTVNCLHPGVIDTKLLHAGFPGLTGKPPSEGARIPVYLALSERVSRISGKYFEESEIPTDSSRLTYDEGVQERLWRVAVELTGTA
ncbi:MAG: SDR family NAD(P)-dependent oxidoreductase [Methanomicrobiales archaeon]|nr:SDR family NAD(P)-dependent oxidoreductase [Methanomicrobiales archaeon]